MADKGKSENPEQVNARPMRGQLECIAQRGSKQYPIDEEKHRMWFRIATEGVKGDGINILASAWKKDIKAWLKKNPVFLPMHNYWTWSIGHGVDVVLDDIGPLVNTEFAYGRNPEATMAWELYHAGDMNAVSVGWETVESHEDEVDDGKDGKTRILVVTRARLLEFSAVPVPMDEDALALRAKSDPFVAAARQTVAIYGCDHCSCGRAERPGWEETEEWIHYRIHDPGDFQEGTYVILSLDVKGTKDVQIKRAKRTGDADDGELHAQAIQFEKAPGWTLTEAKEWWADHKEKIDRMCADASARVEGSGAVDFGAIMEQFENLRTMVGALLVRQPPEPPPKIEITNKPPEPDWLREMRKTAAAVTLTGAELMEEITRHGRDADAETRSE